MNRQPVQETQPQRNVALRTSGLRLQRKCDCGQHTVAGGDCGECRKKRQKQRLQRRAKDQVDPFASLSSLSGSPNAALGSPNAAPRFGRDFSLVSPHASPHARQPWSPSLRTQPRLQRAAKDGTAGRGGEISVAPSAPATANTVPPGPAAGPAPGPASPTTEPATAPERPSPGLLVEDEATDLAPGQMKRTEFLAQLRTAVCATAEAALAGTGQSTDGCPYLDFWFDFYSRQSSQHLERAIHKYAPETARATSASAYIPLIAERVRQGVETWARTGEVTGVPEGIPLSLPVTGLLGAAGGVVSGIGSLFFKARAGGARNAEDPQTIQAQLGNGRPLDSGVRARMESAFGVSFGHVRAHTDNRAAALSASLNARAFTVGKDMAFGAGEYRPGTLVGDALIAHELAHVVQQDGSEASEASMPVGGPYHSTLEEEANRSAVGAVLSLWRRSTNALAEISENALPRLKSGLRLQRCPDEVEEKAEKGASEAAKKTEEAAEKAQEVGKGAAEGKPEKAGEATKTAEEVAPGIDREKPCPATLDSDKVILDHTVDPKVIEKPGDKVTFKVTFACRLKGDGFSKFVGPDDTSTFEKQSFPKGLNELTREWNGKKPFPKVGTFIADDGKYFHRLEPVKYAIKSGKDLMTEGPKHDSPKVEVKARQYKGPGTDHFHFTEANKETLAKIIETEMGGENDKAKKAVAWAVRNQMIRLGTSKVEDAAKHFKDRRGKPASAASKTLAEEILKKPMSDDITQGAIKWFSPNAQPKEGEKCTGEGCGGGLDTFTDEGGKARRVHTPSFHKDMTYVPIEGIHEWRVRFYKL